MQALAGSTLLSLWERGANRHALDRSVLLAAAARPDWPMAGIADLPLGAINTSLLRLRSATFGPHIDGHADCARCGQRLSFSVDARQMVPAPDAAEADDTAPRHTEVAGLRVRAPSLRDLASIAATAAANSVASATANAATGPGTGAAKNEADGLAAPSSAGAAAEADARHAARTLLARCTLSGDVAKIDDAALREVEDALDALDPQADLVLALQCVACGHAGEALLDAGALLWDEIEVRARVLMGEVHRLASAYGWSEAQILALTPARRAGYLAMVGTQ